MILKGSEAKDVIFGDHVDWREVEDKITGQRRWVTEHEAIHEHIPSGKFYMFCYDAPSTESSRTWSDTLWDSNDDVELIEVQQVEKVIRVWEDVNV